MELEIKNAQGELKNVNLRTENNGDERVLAVDLKIMANISSKDVSPLFSDTPEMLATLFDKGGNVLNPVVEFVYRVPVENIELSSQESVRAYDRFRFTCAAARKCQQRGIFRRTGLFR